MNQLENRYKSFVWKAGLLVSVVWGIIVYVGLIM